MTVLKPNKKRENFLMNPKGCGLNFQILWLDEVICQKICNHEGADFEKQLLRVYLSNLRRESTEGHAATLKRLKSYPLNKAQGRNVPTHQKKRPYFDSVVLSCLKRNMCPVCLKQKATSTHHVMPRQQGGSNKKRNIIHVCESCHNILESYADVGKYYTPQFAKILRNTGVLTEQRPLIEQRV